MISSLADAKLPETPVTRFAPSPTGYLHLGHLVNAILVWGIARARGGKVLLRIEDHDRQRSRPDYARAIMEDLDWLGLAADEPPVIQSDRSTLYDEQVLALRTGANVFACECSRRDLVQQGHVLPGTEPRYPGTCRNRGIEWQSGLSLRVELGPGSEEFPDGLMGWQRQSPSEQCGDLAIKDRLNNWTYQFAATVDDYLQGVNLVIRGEDLLSSTGRQIQLARMLGRRVPATFLHHPLIIKPNGEKLSKSSGDTGIRELRGRGESPEVVLGRAAWLGGILRAERPIQAGDLSSVVGALFR